MHRRVCDPEAFLGVRSLAQAGEGKLYLKRVFLHHFILKLMILPRRARDEHRENSKRDRCFLIVVVLGEAQLGNGVRDAGQAQEDVDEALRRCLGAKDAPF